MPNLFCFAIHGVLICFCPANSSLYKINYTSACNDCVRVPSYQQYNENAIIGKWITVQKNLEVEVYKEDNNFKAKMIWFKIEDTTRPMNTRVDEKNPNPALRHQKWIGMEVLRNLKYCAEDNEWQDGIIYDANHGREWASVAWINKNGLLKVKGYWVFKFISQTLTFERM